MSRFAAFVGEFSCQGLQGGILLFPHNIVHGTEKGGYLEPLLEARTQTIMILLLFCSLEDLREAPLYIWGRVSIRGMYVVNTVGTLIPELPYEKSPLIY